MVGRKWETRLKTYGLLHIRKRISPNEVQPPVPLPPHTHIHRLDVGAADGALHVVGNATVTERGDDVRLAKTWGLPATWQVLQLTPVAVARLAAANYSLHQSPWPGWPQQMHPYVSWGRSIHMAMAASWRSRVEAPPRQPRSRALWATPAETCNTTPLRTGSSMAAAHVFETRKAYCITVPSASFVVFRRLIYQSFSPSRMAGAQTDESQQPRQARSRACSATYHLTWNSLSEMQWLQLVPANL